MLHYSLLKSGMISLGKNRKQRGNALSFYFLMFYIFILPSAQFCLCTYAEERSGRLNVYNPQQKCDSAPNISRTKCSEGKRLDLPSGTARLTHSSQNETPGSILFLKKDPSVIQFLMIMNRSKAFVITRLSLFFKFSFIIIFSFL